MCMSNYQRDIDALSTAAIERDHEKAQFLLKKLLAQLDFFVALAAAIEPVYEFVDTWEQYYPDEVWARRLLVAIVSFGAPPDESVSQAALRQDFTAPGAGNFLKAVADIVQSMQAKHQPGARVGYLVSAIVNAVMAELVEFWYRDRPDEWERARLNPFDSSTGKYRDPQATQIAYQFWTDPEVTRRDTQAWLAIAHSIEEKLDR